MVNLNLYTIVLIVLCHLIGDYVLQCDFIAQTKGKNWYHLFVHCALYCIPLYSILNSIRLDMAVGSNLYFTSDY